MGKNVTISTLPNIGQNYLPKINTSNIFANSLVYDDGSSVLINTTTASAFRLDVNGSIRATSGTLTGALSGTSATFSSTLTTNGGIAYVNGTTDAVTYYQIGGTTGGHVYLTSSKLELSAYSTRSIVFETNGVTRLTLASTGAATFSSSVSATSATFSGKLSVSLSSTDYIADFVNTASLTPYGVRIKDAASTTNGYPLFIITNNAATTEYFRVNSGTGAATFSSSVTASGSGSYMQADYFQTGSTPATSGGIRLGTQVAIRARNAANTGNIPLIESTATDAVAIASGGANVGIGTSSPTTYSLSGTHVEQYGGSTYSFFHNNTATVKSFYAINESALLAALFTYSNHPLTFGTNNTERMRITSGGNIVFNGGDANGWYAGFSNSSTNFAYMGATTQFANSGGSSTDFGIRSANALAFYTSGGNERMRITSGGIVCIGTDNTNPAENNVKGVAFYQDGRQFISSDNNEVMRINRKTSDGVLVYFHQDGTAEGNISVSGTTVSYNGGHLARYSQTESNERIEGILKGTVMSNLDKMAEWINPETGEPYANEQLNCMKISDVEGDKNVAGVFVNWDNDDKTFTNDMNIAMTGDMIIRIAKGVIVEKGQLLISAGDGTAKPQTDDIIRSNTIAKVTSNHVTCVYDDESYCVPCVLMAC